MNVTIIGANGNIGKEVTKNFLKKSKSEINSLSLISRSTSSCNQLMSLTQDAFTFFPKTCIKIGSDSSLLKDSDVIVFCAGEAVSSNKMTREMLFEKNKILFENYLKKINTYSPNAIVLVVTNPVSQIIQKVKNPSNIKIIGTGVTNDTYRLKNNFQKKFDYIENKLFMIGDHFTNQEMTLSQINQKLAKQIVDEENEFFKNNKIDDIYDYIRQKNYTLLETKDVTKMFEFVKSVPLKYQGVARQRFVHFLTKTILSTSDSIDHIFNSIKTKEMICCETIVDSYADFTKSVLGIPIKIEDWKIIPVELNYNEKELAVLKKCSEMYPVK